MPANTSAPITIPARTPHAFISAPFSRARPRKRPLPRLGLDIALVPQVQPHRGPQLGAVVALALLVRLEQPRVRVAADQAQPGEPGLEQDRPRPLAQLAGEQ